MNNNLDMMKMMEQMISMSQTLEKSKDTENKQNEMFKLLESMNSINSNKKTIEPKEIYFYDDDILTSNLAIIKCTIPYLKIEQQKILGIMVKLIEIQKLQEKYTYMEKNKLNYKYHDWQHELLESLLYYVDEDKHKKIENAIKFLDMKNLLDNLKSEL